MVYRCIENDIFFFYEQTTVSGQVTEHLILINNHVTL